MRGPVYYGRVTEDTQRQLIVGYELWQLHELELMSGGPSTMSTMAWAQGADEGAVYHGRGMHKSKWWGGGGSCV